MGPYKVAVVIGSNRQDSINRKLALALIKLAPPSLAGWIAAAVSFMNLSLMPTSVKAPPRAPPAAPSAAPASGIKKIRPISDPQNSWTG